MSDLWDTAREAYRRTPVPEELEFAVASALRAGERLRRRRRLRFFLFFLRGRLEIDHGVCSPFGVNWVLGIG